MDAAAATAVNPHKESRIVMSRRQPHGWVPVIGCLLLAAAAVTATFAWGPPVLREPPKLEPPPARFPDDRPLEPIVIPTRPIPDAPDIDWKKPFTTVDDPASPAGVPDRRDWRRPTRQPQVEKGGGKSNAEGFSDLLEN